MRYIISDVHGCYDQLMELLETINFNEDDDLYLLGDVVDRGPEPIKTLKFLMSRDNIHLILGNHDYTMFGLFYELLSKYETLENDDDLTLDELNDVMRWARDGGAVTINQFLEQPIDVQMDIMEYLMNASLYEELDFADKKYILAHAGIFNYEKDKPLDQYVPVDFLYERANYNERLFDDKDCYLITGHTPVVFIRPDGKPEIYKGNGHIAVDCGCVYGGKLAAYCIETDEEFYVDGL